MRAASLVLLLAAAAWAQAPAASAVALSLQPASPVKGRDAVALLDITISGVDQPAPPVLRANVGTLEAVERTGPGRFRARYVLPATRFPEVAIIVAFAPWPHPQAVEGAFGVLRVPIASAVEVPGRAERGAEVRLTLGRETFGPVTAQPDGTFRLPVVVPPGYGVATTTTRDRVGNKRTASLDLMLPPTDQLACVVTPTRLPADGVSKARVLCASSDPYGAPTKGARVQWKGGRGAWSAAKELGDGVQEWAWTAPRELASGAERLTATWKQGKVDSSEEVVVELSQGPVRALTVTPQTEIAHAGGTWRALARATDSQGRPLAGVFVDAPGLPRVLTNERGEAQLEWKLRPDEAQGPRRVEVLALGPLGREPAHLHASRHDGGVTVVVTDLAGLPVPAQRLLHEGREVVTDGDGRVTLPARATLVHADWPGLQRSLVLTEDGPRAGVAASVPVRVGPPLPVNVRVARVASGFEWWVETSSGEVLDGRSIDLREGGDVRRVKSLGRTVERRGPGVVTLTDVDSRVSAVVEVTP